MKQSDSRREVFASTSDLEMLANKESNTPLYMRLSQVIQGHLQNGDYAVGSLLPTETEFAEALGVSRQTVRLAIDQLRKAGLASAKKGVGTRVEARRSQAAYNFSLQSLTDIFQYANETELTVISQDHVAARGRLAHDLGCRPGRQFLHIRGIRSVPGDEHPLCWAEVWVDNQYASIVEGKSAHKSAIFSLIEQASGESIMEVAQSIHAVSIDEPVGKALNAPVGSPALKVVRRYFGSGRRLVEMSTSIYPGNRFEYYIEFKRS